MKKKNEQKLKVELQQVFYLQIEIFVCNVCWCNSPACPCSCILFVEVWEILCNITSLVKQKETKGGKTTKFNNYTLCKWSSVIKD